eukprot:5406533-Pyramimonas_sp.AAC.1
MLPRIGGRVELSRGGFKVHGGEFKVVIVHSTASASSPRPTLGRELGNSAFAARVLFGSTAGHVKWGV